MTGYEENGDDDNDGKEGNALQVDGQDGKNGKNENNEKGIECMILFNISRFGIVSPPVHYLFKRQ